MIAFWIFLAGIVGAICGYIICMIQYTGALPRGELVGRKVYEDGDSLYTPGSNIPIKTNRGDIGEIYLLRVKR